MARDKRRRASMKSRENNEANNDVQNEGEERLSQNGVPKDETAKLDSGEEAGVGHGEEHSPQTQVDVQETTETNKTVAVTETEITEIGNQTIGAALDEQREAQKAAFHKLIDDNVRLKRGKQQAETDCSEIRARYEVKVIELDDERTKCEALNTRVREMEQDIKRLSRAAKQAKKRTPSFRRSPERTGGDSDSDEATMQAPEENYNQNNKYAEQKVKDLQYRLVRLANDDEEKSHRIKSLEKEKAELETLMTELEGHVGAEKMKEVQDAIKQRKENAVKSVDQTNLVKNPNVSTKSGKVENSKVCSIM